MQDVVGGRGGLRALNGVCHVQHITQRVDKRYLGRASRR